MLDKIRDSNFIREYFNEDTLQFWKIIGSIIVALSLLTGISIYFTNNGDGDSKPTNKTVDLSSSDKKSINSLLNSFINDSGSWGGKHSILNNRNIDSIIKTVNTNGKDKSKYFIDRRSAYKTVRDKYIKNNSAIYYNDINIANNWGEDFYSIENLANFSVNNISFTTPKTGTYILGNKDNFVVTVHADFTSVQETVEQTGTDSSWDGSYGLVNKTIKNGGDFTVEKINGVWKVSDAENITKPYPMSFWSGYGDGYKLGNEDNGPVKLIKKYRYAYDL